MFVKENGYIRFAVGAVFGFILTAISSAQRNSVSLEQVAAKAIADYRTLCHRDGGHLWGTSLCGPIMLIDPATRIIYTDRNTLRHNLRANGTLFTGLLPSSVGVANTSIDWAGIRWTMVMLPLPSDRQKRDELVMHEAYHRIQPNRLSPPIAAMPIHLDTLDGRVLLRLEWRALAQALQANGKIRRTAICDALAFRAFRRSLTPGATDNENALEINEGLAEYTGKRLGGGKSAVRSTIAALANYDRRDGYMRSFAYASGPAYGLLLDRLSPRWRAELRSNSDLGEILHHAIGDVVLPEAASVRDTYGYAAINFEETARADVHAQQATQWQAALVDGPVIRLPLIDMNIEFDPQNLFALPPSGTVYPTAIIRDAWGTLTVKQGVLIAQDRRSASVTGPAVANGNGYDGTGWSLTLSPGWIISQGSVQRR